MSGSDDSDLDDIGLVMKRLEPCGVIPPRITPLGAGLKTEPGLDFTLSGVNYLPLPQSKSLSGIVAAENVSGGTPSPKRSRRTM
jgi:hypothetical protein